MAPGAVTTTSTEAVNGSQLKATNDNITTLQGGFTLNSNGANGGAVTAGSTVDIGTATGETNLTVTKTGNTIDFALNKNLDVTSVKTGNSLLNTNGLAITGGPSVLATGIDAGSKKITNVADGTIAAGSKDAVNGGQLKTTNDNVTTNTNNITTLQGGFTLNSNGANGGAIQAGDTVDIGTATGETNLTVTKTGDTIDFALNKNLDVTSVKTGSSLLNTNGLTITGGPSVLATGIDAGSKKITNVADGTIAAG
ncbi:MAG: hypothetical protein LBI97_03635, partial [Acinetobacter sp.]|nr:hypothetical protein [Acinetobacter sp.]